MANASGDEVNFIDELGEAVQRALEAGCTMEEIQADFEALMSVLPTDEERAAEVEANIAAAASRKTKRMSAEWDGTVL